MKRVARWTACVAVVLTLRWASPLLAADGLQRKVLIVGVDGLRADALEQADAPRIHALIKQGAYSGKAQCESYTFSGPNWATIMSGVHIDRHEVFSNKYDANKLKDYPDFFTYLERHNPDWFTVRLITWDAFHNNQPTGADLALYHNMGNRGDHILTDRAAAILAGTDPQVKQDPDVLFLYLGDVDVAGHSKGFSPQAPHYMQAIATMDKQVGQLLDALARRPRYADERWMILLTSDHGGALDRGHGGNTEDRRTVPFLVAGPEAAKGEIFPAPLNVDVARTVLTYMGVPIDPAWKLDGHAVGLEPIAAPRAQYGANLLFNGDAEYDDGTAQKNQTKYDRSCSGWRDEGPAMMTVLTYAGDDGGAYALKPAGAEGADGPDVGNNFFGGGAATVSRMTQRIDLTPMADDIDAAKVVGTLSALLGGYSERGDLAVVTARYYDVSGYIIATTSIGPVTAADRQNKTRLLKAEGSRVITPGARGVDVEVQCIRFKGGQGDPNTGYADNVSLVLTPRPPEPAKK